MIVSSSAVRGVPQVLAFAVVADGSVDQALAAVLWAAGATRLLHP